MAKIKNSPALAAALLLGCIYAPLALADEGETDTAPSDQSNIERPDQGQSEDKSAPDRDEKAAPSESDAQKAQDAQGSGDLKEQASAAEEETSRPFEMLDSTVEPGETRRLSWVASESFAGISVPTPVLVSHGVKPGPTLCLTAAVHGDELNGIEMVRRVLYGLDPETLTGTVVGVPIVNLFGFRRASRYLPDRRDLNRYFPGDPDGSSASRIAYAFFESVVKHCDYLVDLHTGSFHRTNLPQLRADLDNPEILELTRGFGATAVLHSDGQAGTLRRAASDAGVPTVTLEAGEPIRFQPEEVAHGVKGIRTLLNKLGMVKRVSLWKDPQPVYYESDWIRANTGGILFGRVSLGEKVEKDQILGTVTDPITNNRSELRAPQAGRVLGMALNQVVIPGFASFRLGIEKSSEQVAQETEQAPEEVEADTGSNALDKDSEAGKASEQAAETKAATPPRPPKAEPEAEERPD